MLRKEDYDRYDLIIGMDDNNIYDINDIIGEDKDNKVHKLLDYVNDSSNVADPWYTGDFEAAYCDIDESCRAILNQLTK